MKTRLTRTLCALLALVMLALMLPAFADTTDINWDLAKKHYTSAGDSNRLYGTLISSKDIDKVLTMSETSGGWFRFKAPNSGTLYFHVYAPSVSKAFTIYGTGSHTFEWNVSKSSATQVFELKNVKAGDVLYWRDAQLSDWKLFISYSNHVVTQPTTYIENLIASASSYYVYNNPSVAPSCAIDDNESSSWDSWKEYEGAWFSVSIADGSHLISGFSIMNGKCWTVRYGYENYYKNSRIKDYSIYIDGKYKCSGRLLDTNEWQSISFGGGYVGSTLKIVVDSVYKGSMYHSSNYGVCITEFKLY